MYDEFEKLAVHWEQLADQMWKYGDQLKPGPDKITANFRAERLSKCAEDLRKAINRTRNAQRQYGKLGGRPRDVAPSASAIRKRLKREREKK